MKVLDIRKILISEIVTMIEHGEMTNAISTVRGRGMAMNRRNVANCDSPKDDRVSCRNALLS